MSDRNNRIYSTMETDGQVVDGCVPVEELKELVDGLRSKQERHIERGGEKQGDVVANYHYGYSDCYEIVADRLERLVEQYE